MPVAIIPARGGSQRIPHKNIKLFAGIPMIQHSIEAAQKSQCFDRVIVSTDDAEIAEVALKAGAEVPFTRPAKLADAHTGTAAVMQHAAQWLVRHGPAPEFLCCLYATAPFVTPEDLQQGLKLLKQSRSMYVFTATEFTYPIQRALQLDAAKGVCMREPEHLNSRSQDLTPCYHDAGQFYWGKTHAFIEQLTSFDKHSRALLVPHYRVQDIDTPEDWVRAELMYRAWQESQSQALDNNSCAA